MEKDQIEDYNNLYENSHRIIQTVGDIFLC